MSAPRLAVIGGGQLARMMAAPAGELGIALRLLAEAEGVSAAQVIPDHVVGDHRDLNALLKAVEGCGVVTFDHEHVPADHLRALQEHGVEVRPGPDALVHAQDKAVMRARLTELGVPCPRHALVDDLDDVAAFGLPCVLKTTRGGYDGKGVWVVRDLEEANEAFWVAEQTGVRVLAEELVQFRRELSALVARRPGGETAAYPVAQTTQLGGICHEVIAPAPKLSRRLAAQARDIAETLARELGVVGVLAVELFETADGRVLVNELAMRPHNTGHWSQDGAATSQFENHLRAVLDLPLGSPEPHATWSVMVNVLGGDADGTPGDRLAQALAVDPEVKVHLYGKELRPGRKVGHVTVVGGDLDSCLTRARRAAAILVGGGE